MSNRVSLYLQDAHDLRDGLDYVRYAEQKGFEVCLAGRITPGQGCSGTDGGICSRF